MINQDKLSAEELENAKALLRLAYQQYMLSLEVAARDPSVVETVAIYKQIANEFEVFAAVNDRAPLWENADERQLHNRIEALLYVQQVNHFGQVTPYIEKLFTLVERYPLPRMPEEQALKGVTDFFEEHGHLPQSVRLRDVSGALPNEALLYESMVYWQLHSNAFNEAVGKLNYYSGYHY